MNMFLDLNCSLFTLSFDHNYVLKYAMNALVLYAHTAFHKCRVVSGIRGFTRETLSAVIVNIESREWRRQYNIANAIPPEHPRASTTDDVECFFSVLRDMVGKDLTHKEVSYNDCTYIFTMSGMYDVNTEVLTYIVHAIVHVGDVWLEEGLPRTNKENGPSTAFFLPHIYTPEVLRGRTSRF